MGNLATVRLLAMLIAADWWPLGIIPVLLGILAAVRVWKKDELVRLWKENKRLRADNAKLEREAIIRLDDLKDCWKQIDSLTDKVADQRETARKLAIENDERTQA